jgi:tRNA threonylcarbamoyladenosine biosynthesis protein TsaB
MKTVAIDTSLSSGSVAAVDGERVAEVRFSPAQAHAKRIAAGLAEATAELGWSIAEADLVAVIRGPGSFPGLRVGIAAAKGIAWAGGMRLVGVSGFEVIAAAVGGGEPIHVAFDAGRGECLGQEHAVCGLPASRGCCVGEDDANLATRCCGCRCGCRLCRCCALRAAARGTAAGGDEE